VAASQSKSGSCANDVATSFVSRSGSSPEEQKKHPLQLYYEQQRH
jgi:hypothetical protein